MEVVLLAKFLVIVGAGLMAQWASWSLKIPSILLLLVTGFAIGPVGGIVQPDQMFGDLLFPFASAAVALILFEGGLNLRFSDIEEVQGAVFRLATLGIVVTWMGGSLAAWLLFRMRFEFAVLLGAILVVTGPTVIGPMMRQIQPRKRVAELLRWEGILNDPIGAVLSVLTFEFIVSGTLEAGTFAAVSGLVTTIGSSLVAAAVGAAVLVVVLGRFWVPDHLQQSLVLVVALAVHTGCNAVQPESGLLGVTALGAVLANQSYVSVDHIVEFKEHLRVLLIGTLFVVLAARVETATLYALDWRSVVFVLGLIFVVRPFSVLASTLGSELTWSERGFLCAVAPRGIVAAAVASVLGLKLVEAGVLGGTETMISQTFAVVALTVLFYGVVAGPIARWLGLSNPDPQGVLIVGAHDWARELAEPLEDHGFRVLFVDRNRRNVREARMTGHEAYHGSVVAENLEETLPLGGIGRLVAVTGNDETNLLAGVEFSHAFGRANVFHLKPQPGPGGVGRQGIRQSVQARILSREGCHYEEFERRFEAGADVAVTRLTEVFTYGDFVNEYDNPIELFTIRGDEFRVVEEGAGHHPAPGDIIVSVVGGTNVSSTEKSDGLRARPHRETRAYDGMERLRMVEVLTEEPS